MPPSYSTHYWLLFHSVFSSLAYVASHSHVQRRLPLVSQPPHRHIYTNTRHYAVISKDRHEEAKATLMRLNDDNEDPSFWEKEYLQISAQIALEKREMEGSSWIHMFTNMKEFRRVAVAAASVISVQTNGAQTIQVFQVS